MSSVRVVEALGSALRDAFIELPFRLYQGDPVWVAPLYSKVRRDLDPEKSPFARRGSFAPLLALRGDRVVGRVVALDDRAYNEFHGTHHGFFGCLEGEEDIEVFSALLDEAGRWCSTRGADTLLGPMNFSTSEDCGLLLQGHDEAPLLHQAHTPPGYAMLVEQCGLRKAWDYLAYKLPVDREPTGSLLRFAEAVQRTHRLRLRHADRRHYEDELRRVLDVYGRAWQAAPGYAPLSDAELHETLVGLRPLLHPELLLLAEARGELVGFSLSVPDLNEALRHLRGRLLSRGLVRALWALRRLRGLRLCCLGVLPEYARAGVSALFFLETLVAARRLGYESVELSLALEQDLALNRGIEGLGGLLCKRWRIYQKALVT